MKTPFKLFGCLLVVLIAVVVTIQLFVGNSGLKMNTFVYMTPPEAISGMKVYEDTFENNILFSTHIFTAKILEDQEGVESGDSSVVKAKVISSLVNSITDLSAGDIVYLRLRYNNALELGNSYLLFAEFMHHPAMAYDTYSISCEHVYMIDHKGVLWRLQDPENKEYIVPFQEAEYNQIGNLTAYIKDYAERHAGEREMYLKEDVEFFERFVMQPANLEELIEASESIAVITVTQVESAAHDLSLVRAYYTVREVFKGNPRELSGDHLILPAGTVVGETYLCFLNGVTLTSRFGSFFSAGVPEYQPLLEDLRNQR